MGTWRVLRAEAYRLVRSRLMWSCAVALALLSALRVLAERISESAVHRAAVQRALDAGREPPPFEPGNAYGPFVDGWLAGLIVGTLLLLMLSSLSIARDRDAGIARIAATRSASRGGLLFGRAALGVPLVLGMMAVTGLGAWIAAAQLFAFGPLVEHGYELATVDELRTELFRSALATVPPLLATWTFGLLVSCRFRSPVAAVGCALASFLAFDLFKDVLGDGRWWVFASFNPSLVDDSCMAEMASIARGMSDAGYTEAIYGMNLVLPWPEAVLLTLLAWWSLSRRPL